jgi:hypothetical protein
MLKSVLAVSLGLLILAPTAESAVRRPLMEYYTNVQCPPCATYDATIVAFQNAHLSDTSFINYHMSWPGYDPFYSNNTVDNNARRSAYTVNYVPYISIGTVEADPFTSSMNQKWNQAMTVPCYADISLSGVHVFGTGGGTLEVTITTEASFAATDPRLFIAVNEVEVEWNGTGSYDIHDWVLRDIVTANTGDPLSIGASETVVLPYAWDAGETPVGPDIKEDDLVVTVWIQNGTNGQIEQSAMIYSGDMVAVATPDAAGNILAGIAPNHPNPFNPTTSIPIVMEEAGNATVQIFDASGSLVRTLNTGALPTGTTNLRWDGTTEAGIDAPSGVYFVRMETAGLVDSRAIALLK